MSILETAFDRLARDFRNGTPDQSEWDDAMSAFEQALSAEDDPKIIEKCVILDQNWELPVESKMNLLNKGKAMGISSIDFITEYHKYMCAHLDYDDPYKDVSCRKLQEIFDNLVHGPGWKVERKGDTFVFEFLSARHGGGTDAYEITEKEFNDLKAGYLHFEDLMIKYDQGPFKPIKSS